MKINDVIEYSKEQLKKAGLDDYIIISKMLIEHFFKISKESLVTHKEDDVFEEEFSSYKRALDKVLNGTPVQYVTNKQEFMNILLYVDENVLIPQPDTEILVEEVLKEYGNSNCKILDMCTGSGAIGISIAKNIASSEVYVSDISFKALQIAKLNAENNLVHKKMHFIESDMFENVDQIQFDCIVSNPPYIRTDVIDTLDNQVKSEPHIALDGGEDGLKFYRIIADIAYKYIKDGGKLFIEIGYDQRDSVTNILKEVGRYENIYSIKDYGQNDRVIVATVRR